MDDFSKYSLGWASTGWQSPEVDAKREVQRIWLPWCAELSHI